LKLYHDDDPNPPAWTLTPLPTREQQVQSLASNKQFDVLVIGGGATGCGVALDAVSRGMTIFKLLNYGIYFVSMALGCIKISTGHKRATNLLLLKQNKSKNSKINFCFFCVALHCQIFCPRAQGTTGYATELKKFKIVIFKSILYLYSKVEYLASSLLQ